MARVAIIGGGPGGLMTAYLIAHKYDGECVTTIYEAAGRLGGKLRTRTFTAAPVPYESGAAEIYDYSSVGEDRFRRLVDDLGIATRPMTGHTIILEDTVLRDDADVARRWGDSTLRAIRDFRQRAADFVPLEQWHPGSWRFDAEHPWARRSCAELLDTVHDPIARKYLAVAAHSDLATEPHLTDGLNGLKNFVMDIPGYVACHAVEGGMSRLAERLSQRIGHAEVRLNARVLRIERVPDRGSAMADRGLRSDPRGSHDGAWRVVSTRGGKQHADEFDAIVIALPATQLSSIEYAGELPRRAMQAHIAHFDRPGHYLRVSLLFRSPFWNDRLTGSWFMVDAFGGACAYDESARYDTRGYGVLGFLIAGNDALTMANADEPVLVRRVLDSLPAALRGQALEQFVEARVHRWCGAISAQPGGYPVRDPRTTHQPDRERLPGLLLVGDYLFDSTLNGVHQSADLATSLLSSHLNTTAAQAA